jgi:ribonuclease P protein component
MLSKVNRLKGKANFAKVFKRGEKHFSPYFVLYILRDQPQEQVTVGFVASKKVGGAVERNRSRRLLSEAVRLTFTSFPQHAAIVFIALKPAATAQFKDIYAELNKIFP